MHFLNALELYYEFELFFIISLIESFLMPPKYDRLRAQQGQIGSSTEVDYEKDLLKCLTHTLGKVGFFASSMKQTRRLEAISFGNSIDLAEILLWLANIEKILEEGM